MVETEATARGVMVKEAMATMNGALEAAVATEVEATLVATERTGRHFNWLTSSGVLLPVIFFF